METLRSIEGLLSKRPEIEVENQSEGENLRELHDTQLNFSDAET
jgi:hypothetical protein